MTVAALSSILKQMLDGLPVRSFPPEIKRVYEGKKSGQPSQDDLMRMLLAVPHTESVDGVFLVCDGLDEMDRCVPSSCYIMITETDVYHSFNQRDHLFPLLHGLKAGGFSIFLTSRPHPRDVLDAFSNKPRIVDFKPNRDEVKRYTETRIKNTSSLRELLERFPTDHQRTIIEVLVDSGREI